MIGFADFMRSVNTLNSFSAVSGRLPRSPSSNTGAKIKRYQRCFYIPWSGAHYRQNQTPLFLISRVFYWKLSQTYPVHPIAESPILISVSFRRRDGRKVSKVCSNMYCILLFGPMADAVTDVSHALDMTS